jgi:hypothetical protein
MSKRFGKARVPGCQCDTSFTCGPCLKAPPSYFFTPLKRGELTWTERHGRMNRPPSWRPAQ